MHEYRFVHLYPSLFMHTRVCLCACAVLECYSPVAQGRHQHHRADRPTDQHNNLRKSTAGICVFTLCTTHRLAYSNPTVPSPHRHAPTPTRRHRQTVPRVRNALAPPGGQSRTPTQRANDSSSPPVAVLVPRSMHSAVCLSVLWGSSACMCVMGCVFRCESHGYRD